MNSGSLAQMSHNSFGAPALGMPMSGLASRRGGQSIKPLSIDAVKPGTDKDNGLVTPRTSRSHLLAGLRTAPKSATAATFPQSPTTAAPVNNNSQQARNGMASGLYGGASDHHAYSNGPKTSLPRFAQSQTYNNQHYTAEEILAPPEIQIDEHDVSTADADYAELVATNMYLAAQKQRLQQQLMSVQAAQQQFQNLNLAGGNGGNATAQQQAAALQQAAYQQMLYQQQQQQQQPQQQVYAVVDPVTGQQTLYVGQGNAQLNNHYMEQYNANLQQLQHLQLLQQQLQQQQLQSQQQQHLQNQNQNHQTQYQQHLYQPYHNQQQHRQASPISAPRVQVSPPPGEDGSHSHSMYGGGHRNLSPPRRFESSSASDQHAPLPPPSANAFRRGHKKSASLVASTTLDVNNASSSAIEPKSAGPKATSFPPNVMQAPSQSQASGTYGPGQGRAGEHPVRQPRGPPNLEELVRKPTSKHEDSKNFATRTRRSAVHNLVRAGFTRRQGTGGSGSGSGSPGSISPISETTEHNDEHEDLATPLTDDESVSGRSGSGSLNGDDVECSLPSSRTSTGSWGAIGSERPGSREKEKGRKSTESLKDAAATASSTESGPGSFASMFKTVAKPASTDEHRRAPMLVLSNAAEKRRFAV
ncbi:hypothetical protein HMPREF1624_03779 [Sporothrix schenckii ATCC 58251]|uniref:Uncharacterized protein n=1 Tax=Sporothrix schenckii (strain ATCC 58251 / de Perez 2211183) TaxID=1391915 RepID=U7PXW0_SPOS1|nr:hypothetical protein HMPREF1624_03779 [Sporothrix schenckii ATCC 58251]